MTADILALLSPDSPDTWPQGILAAAEKREKRARNVLAISKSPWIADGETVLGPEFADGSMRTVAETVYAPEAEHIAAEASPAHALAAVRQWRGVVERHGSTLAGFKGEPKTLCRRCHVAAPCPDLTETADEARAYVGTRGEGGDAL